MASLELKDLRKVYPSSSAQAGGPFGKKRVKAEENGVVAVSSFSLSISDKEFIVLVGPSGCGKSTVLRMIAGLEDVTEGEIYIGGKDVTEEEPKDRDVAMVFQNYALYPHMSVYDNMAFAIRKRCRNKMEVDERVRGAASVLGITDVLHRKPRELSGGQRQRVAIGRAIVRNPRVMLMDEPLSNLDAKMRSQMRGEILKLRKKTDATFVYVTHDQTEAMTLGDRIVVMKDGTIQQIGTPDEVYEAPENVFVASFIGSPEMNLFPSSAVREEEDFSLSAFGMKFALPGKMSQILSKEGSSFIPLTSGIRPESIKVSVEGGDLEMTVTISEHLGSGILITAEDGEGRELRALSEDKSLSFLKEGDRVFFSLDCLAMFHFGSDGRNILSGVKR
ncbi:MAG: ABC transporter ATP-binding protein [Candidatus Ornithospirochaeta sp.]